MEMNRMKTNGKGGGAGVNEPLHLNAEANGEGGRATLYTFFPFP